MVEGFGLIVFLPSVGDALASVRGSYLAPLSTILRMQGGHCLLELENLILSLSSSAHPTIIEKGGRCESSNPSKKGACFFL